MLVSDVSLAVFEKFRIAQNQQLPSIQFDMLKNLLSSMTNS